MIKHDGLVECRVSGSQCSTAYKRKRPFKSSMKDDIIITHCVLDQGHEGKHKDFEGNKF
jgi:hypothetical protein